jgi:hypothetical protein
MELEASWGQTAKIEETLGAPKSISVVGTKPTIAEALLRQLLALNGHVQLLQQIDWATHLTRSQKARRQRRYLSAGSVMPKRQVNPTVTSPPSP